MKNRTVLIVLGIAVVMLAFILLFERESMTTDELELRKDRVFVDFRREAVEGLKITGVIGEQIALERVGGGEEDDGKWKIVAPRELAADGTAVRGVLSALDYLLKDRTVRGEEVAADPIYGLTEPRITASFTIRGSEVGFRVGADSKDGEKVYVALDDTPEEFFAVEKDFFESINVGLDELRDKHLVPGSLSDATGLSVLGKSSALSLEREPGERWTIERDGAKVAAAEDQVGELLAALGNLEAAAFVAEGYEAQDAAKYGFDSESRSATVLLPDREDEIRLMFGKPCAGEHLVHAADLRSGTVACVADEILALLDRPAERLCEMRAAVFREEDVAKITISRGGSELVLERDDDQARWTLIGKDAPAVEQAAVGELLEALRTERATSLGVGDEAVGGLGAAAAEVTLELEAGQQPIALSVWAADEGGKLLLRRGDEPALLTYDTNLLELIEADPLAFRKRSIENGEHDDVVALAIRGPVDQRLERDGDSWKLVSPLEIAADGPSARELVRLLATVEVTRFVSSKAQPVHGLGQPWAVVTASFVEEQQDDDVKDRTKERQLTLEIGAEAEPGTRFGRIRGDDPSVFVLGEAYLTVVSRPLAARDLLQVDDTALAKIELRRGERTLVAERGDEGWTSPDEPVNAAAIGRLVADLGATKAIRTAAFGTPPSPVDPLTVRTWTAEQLAADAPSALVLGGASDDPAEEGRLAWRSDLAVTFVLPARIVDAAARLLEP